MLVTFVIMMKDNVPKAYLTQSKFKTRFVKQIPIRWYRESYDAGFDPQFDLDLLKSSFTFLALCNLSQTPASICELGLAATWGELIAKGCHR